MMMLESMETMSHMVAAPSVALDVRDVTMRTREPVGLTEGLSMSSVAVASPSVDLLALSSGATASHTTAVPLAVTASLYYDRDSTDGSTSDIADLAGRGRSTDDMGSIAVSSSGAVAHAHPSARDLWTDIYDMEPEGSAPADAFDYDVGAPDDDEPEPEPRAVSAWRRTRAASEEPDPIATAAAAKDETAVDDREAQGRSLRAAAVSTRIRAPRRGKLYRAPGSGGREAAAARPQLQSDSGHAPGEVDSSLQPGGDELESVRAEGSATQAYGPRRLGGAGAAHEGVNVVAPLASPRRAQAQAANEREGLPVLSPRRTHTSDQGSPAQAARRTLRGSGDSRGGVGVSASSRVPRATQQLGLPASAARRAMQNPGGPSADPQRGRAAARPPSSPRQVGSPRKSAPRERAGSPVLSPRQSAARGGSSSMTSPRSRPPQRRSGSGDGSFSPRAQARSSTPRRAEPSGLRSADRGPQEADPGAPQAVQSARGSQRANHRPAVDIDAPPRAARQTQRPSAPRAAAGRVHAAIRPAGQLDGNQQDQ
jgi:hypothetical protein